MSEPLGTGVRQLAASRLLGGDTDDWSLAAAFEARVRLTPNRPFVGGVGAVPFSYAQFATRAGCLASDLRTLGVEPGDCVGVVLGDRVTSILAWLAIEIAGGVEVPVNPDLVGRPLLHALATSRTRYVIVDEALAGIVCALVGELPDLQMVVTLGDGDRLVVRARQTPQPRPGRGGRVPTTAGGSLACILYTSGTSGLPKGVMVTQAQGLLTASAVIRGLELSDADIAYCAHPMFHMAAKQCIVIASVLSGMRIVIDNRFDASRWLDRVRECGATATISHGPMLEMIFDQPPRADDAENPMRRFITSPFPQRIAERFEQRFDVRGVEVWGMTEVGIPCWSDLNEPIVPGTCGRPLTDLYDVALFDPDTDDVCGEGEVGEFRVRPRYRHTITSGYFGNPQATADSFRDGWFCSGDLGRQVGGTYSFVARKSHRIRRRAESISPQQIEEAALDTGLVIESAAIGVPSGYGHDEDIRLFVVPKDPASFRQEDMLRALAPCLPHFMIPRYVTVLEKLPRNHTSKVSLPDLVASDAPMWDRKANGIRVRDLKDSVARDPSR